MFNEKKKYDIKMFGFITKVFFTVLTILSTLTSVNSSRCILMTNKECKVRQKLLMLIVMSLYFILLLLKQLNVVAVVTATLIHMQKFVFLMLQKT